MQLWFGWAFYITAMGVLATLHVDSGIERVTGALVLVGFGSGIIYASTYFPVLAPLPVSENAHALAFIAFCRSFAGVRLLSLRVSVRTGY